jgi:hypothetical protein
MNVFASCCDAQCVWRSNVRARWRWRILPRGCGATGPCDLTSTAQFPHTSLHRCAPRPSLAPRKDPEADEKIYGAGGGWSVHGCATVLCSFSMVTPWPRSAVCALLPAETVCFPHGVALRIAGGRTLGVSHSSLPHVASGSPAIKHMSERSLACTWGPTLFSSVRGGSADGSGAAIASAAGSRLAVPPAFSPTASVCGSTSACASASSGAPCASCSTAATPDAAAAPSARRMRLAGGSPPSAGAPCAPLIFDYVVTRWLEESDSTRRGAPGTGGGWPTT